MKRTRGKITNYSMDLSPDKTQRQDWEFPVYQEELVTSHGAKSGIHAVCRGDTNEMIGQYSGEKVLPYKDLVSTFESGLTEAGFEFTRNLMVTGNGARFFGRYAVGQEQIGQEVFENVLRLQSSHNGTMMAGFSFESMRLVCLNGMMTTAEVFSIYKKHSSNLDIAFLGDNIREAVEAGNQHLTRFVDKMSNIKITDGGVRNMLSNIVTMGSSKGVSNRAGYVIYDNWCKPSQDEKPLGDTLYRLYNASTRFTREVEKKRRFEMSRRANLFLTGAMDLACQNDFNLQKLLVPSSNPLDFDNVTVEQN